MVTVLTGRPPSSSVTEPPVGIVTVAVWGGGAVPMLTFGVAVGPGGAPTVGVYVELADIEATVSRYVTGVAVPVKPLAGVKVMTPVTALRVYPPCAGLGDTEVAGWLMVSSRVTSPPVGTVTVAV